MSQWIDLDDDDLVCEICEEKETVLPYCVSCVNKHLTLMSLFSNGWDYSESAKLRVYEAICEAHREERRGLRAAPRRLKNAQRPTVFQAFGRLNA